MAKKSMGLADDLYQYLLDHSLRESQLLNELRQETEKLEKSRMQISPDQGQFMSLLAGLIGARKVLEIGVYTGYSSLCLALSLPADGQIIACDISKEWTDIARAYWRKAGVDGKI